MVMVNMRACVRVCARVDGGRRTVNVWMCVCVRVRVCVWKVDMHGIWRMRGCIHIFADVCVCVCGCMVDA